MTPKYRHLAELLRERIGQRPDQPMKLPTERELAAMYRVSRQTVRQALGLLAEEGLIEKKQGSGNYANPEKREVKQIALLLPSKQCALSPVIREAETAFVAGGCSVQIYSTENQIGREREILENLLKSQVDGICVKAVRSALPNPNLDHYRRLSAKGCALLFLDGCYRGLEETALSVAPDNLAGGYQAVRRLMQAEHVRIGCLFDSEDLQGLERFEGVACAVRDYGLPMADGCYFWYGDGGSGSFWETEQRDWRSRIVRRLRQSCSAVICQDERAASWLFQGLLETEAEAMEAFSLLYFDDGYFTGTDRIPALSLSCRQSHPGRIAADILLRRIFGRRAASVKLRWEYYGNLSFPTGNA